MVRAARTPPGYHYPPLRGPDIPISVATRHAEALAFLQIESFRDAKWSPITLSSTVCTSRRYASSLHRRGLLLPSAASTLSLRRSPASFRHGLWWGKRVPRRSCQLTRCRPNPGRPPSLLVPGRFLSTSRSDGKHSSTGILPSLIPTADQDTVGLRPALLDPTVSGCVACFSLVGMGPRLTAAARGSDCS